MGPAWMSNPVQTNALAILRLETRRQNTHLPRGRSTIYHLAPPLQARNQCPWAVGVNASEVMVQEKLSRELLSTSPHVSTEYCLVGQEAGPHLPSSPLCVLTLEPTHAFQPFALQLSIV